jgi:AraC-like DNA-binding protein
MLLRDGDLAVGEFVCPPGDWRWDGENDIGDGFHLVFPWMPVHIARASLPGMVATPNHAVLYPPGLRFRRRNLTGQGDHCLFAVLSPAMCGRLGLPDQPEHLFDPVLAPTVWLGQRLLAEYLARPGHGAEVAGQIARMVIVAALANRPARSCQAARGAVEQAMELMATSPGRLLPLAQIARGAHYSRFHLLRAFHDRTGYTLHQYHLQLRLRRSVDLVLAGAPLADIAHSFGFQGHSHFTARFHRAFGETPSALRTAVDAGDSVPELIGRLLTAA